MKKAYSTPQIFGVGRIIRAENFDSNELYIKWEIIHGSNFKLIDGKIKGETFQSVAHVIFFLKKLGESFIYFDHPLAFNYSCTSIKGWPKISVEVWSTDSESRNYLIGYGSMFFPFKKGNNKLRIECWRPTKTFRYNFSENFLNTTPEFIDKSAVYSTDEKFGISSISAGSVIVEIDLILKDFDLHGIKVV